MKNTLTLSLAVSALGLAMASPAAAQERIGPNSYAVALKAADRNPDTPEAARRMLIHIEKAAFAVCGASPFSLREVQRSVRHSACWRDSVAETVARIGNPLLTQAYSSKY
ncbi:UrcA family protein [Novosphingobium beihaiensis]|uniref:UrcA family protein n=1 Tax=Novosphingobium beihaiensis TaxID=2930389 RepID=A0ABT0BKY6_9SPHN|nr:UrcA family protein [Novosphingobium beihaiensis]MCJ2185726.1 UrcA family protein [Novosphingobium beihaiensis]